MIARVCEHCKTTYQTFPSIRKQFCGKACADKAKATGTWIPCQQCGEQMYSRPAQPRQFCSLSCKTTARNLSSSNPAYHRDISGERNPMRGRGMVGADNPMYGKRKEKSPRWKGGRKVRKDGYVLVIAPDDHPYPADVHSGSGLKYILEHRHVMERHLGRYLEPVERVHHRDENPTNNALANLELFADQSAHMRIGHGIRGR